MKKSVLVDFYNLQLQSGFIEEPTTEQLLNGQIFIFPDENERRRIIEFFETHAPQALKKLPPERKQQISDFFNWLFGEYPGRLFLDDFLQIIKDNRELYIDAYTTLDGYEARNGHSWFDGTSFHSFCY